MLESGEKDHFRAIDYMTVLIMASLFHDPLDSQAPPPCTLKSAPLAKIKPLATPEHTSVAGRPLAFKRLSRHKLAIDKQVCFVLALFAGL